MAAAPQRVLCERITTHLRALFVFVEDPAVPATNNAAERSLRHLVTSRKISGGTRSPAGTATKMTLATLFGTWRLQGLRPAGRVPRPPRQSATLNSYANIDVCAVPSMCRARRGYAVGVATGDAAGIGTALASV